MDVTCYCALCCVPLRQCDFQVGSQLPGDLARRRRRVDRERQARLYCTRLSDKLSKITPGIRGYDPVLLKEGWAWVEDLVCLGRNDNLPGPQRAYLSGNARCVRNETPSILIADKGDDSNFPVHGQVFLYGYRNILSMPLFDVAFPRCCLEILTKVIAHRLGNAQPIDKDVLYHIFTELAYANYLRINYGLIVPTQRRWVCTGGTEHLVSQPLRLLHLRQNLLRRPSLLLDKTRSQKFQWCARRDVFSKLPYDILHQILLYLPGDSILALLHVSSSFNAATSHNFFWKKLIYRSMPWFWELKTQPWHSRPGRTDIDFKQLYLLLNRELSVPYGLRGSMRYIANRMRIWNACDQICEYYAQFTSPDVPVCATDEQANAIKKYSKASHVSLVLYPSPQDDILVSAQWVRCWDEIYKLPSLCEVFLTKSPDRCLAGLSMSFNGARRTFGCVDPALHDCEPFYICRGDWIVGFVAYMRDFRILEEQPRTCITGLRICLKSGLEYGGKQTEPLQRPFLVSPGHELVGLVGQVKNGVIARFGILECRRSNSLNQDQSSIFQRKQSPSRGAPPSHLLWHSYEDSFIRGPRGPHRGHRASYWLRPLICVLPLPHTQTDGHEQFDSDLIPYTVIFWMGRKKTREALRSVWANIGPSGNITDLDVCLVNCDNPTGLAEFCTTFDPGYQNFEIDGIAGEHVTEVRISSAYSRRAIQLKTNFGRECCFGDGNGQEWTIQRSPVGEVICGLAIAFGLPANWNEAQQRYTGGKLTSATALTVRADHWERIINRVH